MIGLLIFGIIFIVLGVYASTKGSVPLLKHYEGVKDIALQSRINGAAIIGIGLVLISDYFIEFQSGILIVALLTIAAIALALQVILKAI